MEKIINDGPAKEIINQKVLKDIYEMDMQIEEINNQRICVLFRMKNES